MQGGKAVGFLFFPFKKNKVIKTIPGYPYLNEIRFVYFYLQHKLHFRTFTSLIMFYTFKKMLLNTDTDVNLRV